MFPPVSYTPLFYLELLGPILVYLTCVARIVLGNSPTSLMWSITIAAVLPILIGFANTLQGFSLFLHNADPQTNGLYDGPSAPIQLYLVLAPLRLGVGISIVLLSIEGLFLVLKKAP
jgi:hypothetical protein